MSIQCEIDIPKVEGLQDQQLTVGREFYLICKGDWPKTLQQNKLAFVGDANTKYQLRLLQFEFRSPEEADLKVTSHLAGKHQFEHLQISDGSETVDLSPLNFEVHSVLPAQGATAGTAVPGGAPGGEKIEPYGPFGPATIAVPVLYWLLLLGGLLLIALLVGLRIWRHHQRREMLLRLKEHDSALSPLMEFHQSMRRLQRSNPVFYGKEATPEELRGGVKELSRMFKVYVSRRLKVPAFEWNERLILADLKKYHARVYQEYSKRIHDLFSEFRKAEDEGQKLDSKDVSQLAQTLRRHLEGIEDLMNEAEASSQKKRSR